MDCVEVCPVDCFHVGPNFITIDPDECIDCTLCEPECPAQAIFAEDDVPAGQEAFIALNAELSKKWPVLTEKKPAPADAADWDGKPNKLALFFFLLLVVPQFSRKISGLGIIQHFFEID